jgi:hypothetical protein
LKSRRPSGGDPVFFDSDVRAAITPVLRDIEQRLSWHAHEHLSVEERIAKIGGALLTLKEIEYFGAAQPGEFQDRLDRLIDRLLVPLEAEWLKGRRGKDIVQRVKLLRIAMLPGMAAGTVAKSELHRRWRHLADIYLAQQLAFDPPGYLSAHPTP